MPKYCRYCGTELEGEFCHECGSSDNIEPQYEQPEPTIPKIDQDHKESEMEELCEKCKRFFPPKQLFQGICRVCIGKMEKQYDKETVRAYQKPKCSVCGVELNYPKSIDEGKCCRCSNQLGGDLAKPNILPKSAIYASEPLTHKQKQIQFCSKCRCELTKPNQIQNGLCPRCIDEQNNINNKCGKLCLYFIMFCLITVICLGLSI